MRYPSVLEWYRCFVHPKGWVIQEDWIRPSGLYPEYSVFLLRNSRHRLFEVAVVRDGWVVRRVACRHPATWPRDYLEVRAEMAKFVDRVATKVTASTRLASPAVAAWANAYPALWEYLTLDAYEDGEARLTSMLMFFAEDGCFKGCLQDRQEGRSLWVTGESLVLCLDALEARLQAGNADWRQMKSGLSGKSKRR